MKQVSPHRLSSKVQEKGGEKKSRGKKEKPDLASSCTTRDTGEEKKNLTSHRLSSKAQEKGGKKKITRQKKKPDLASSCTTRDTGEE
jgi:hypothetical protein